MKYYLFVPFIIIYLISMIIFPAETFSGASQGLDLWFQTILPTLLPFIIVSNIIIRTNLINLISKLLSPVICRIFRISSSSCYALISGYLCGYPMGAKVITELISANKISLKEGQHLLSFCNNASPMFIVSYLITNNLKDNSLILPTIIILYSVPIIYSLVFHSSFERKTYNSREPLTLNFQCVDSSIMDGFETITKIGGYIILFSILFNVCQRMPFKWILPYLEISSGIAYYTNLNISFVHKYVLSMGLTSFGGCCCILQTASIIQDSGLSIWSYIKTKLITAMVTSFLAYIYITIILQ